MNNPKGLKIIVVILVVVFMVSFHFLVRALVANFDWQQCVELSAPLNGAMFARQDFQSGKLRLFVISGARSNDKYSGTNDGPFQIWFPPYQTSPYPMRFSQVATA